MGPRKVQQASSARAANTLTKGSASGFGGFSGATAVQAVPGFAFGGAGARGGEDAASPSGARAIGDGGEPAVSAQLDSEIAQLLRHLSKRDPTTKLKALQALGVRVRERSAAPGGAADLASALPPWVYMYRRLVADGNRGVRAEAAAVLGALAAAVGKAIAPHLKGLMGPWWVAQFDPYTDAAAAARSAFQASFPGRKQLDALLFCRAEVLEYLQENIAATPQQLGDVKKESSEELEDRHERVVSSSLLALSMLLEVVAGAAAAGGPRPAAGGDTADAAVEATAGAGSPAAAAAASAAAPGAAAAAALVEIGAQLTVMLGKAGFLKGLLVSKTPLVRRATYTFVRAVAAQQPAPLSGVEVAVSVLGLFQEKDSANHSAMWDVLLTFVQACPACWEQVSLRKVVLPRLYAFLRHACYGSAVASYPALLPFTALLPAAALGPSPDVVAQLLDCVWAGWRDAGLGGRPGKVAAGQAYREVLLWALLNSQRLGSSAAAAALAAASDAASAVAEVDAASADVDAASAAAYGYCQALLRGGSLLEGVLPTALCPGSERDIAVGLVSELLGQLVTALAGRTATDAASAATGQGAALERLCRAAYAGPALSALVAALEAALVVQVAAAAAAATSAGGAAGAAPGASLEGVADLLLRLKQRGTAAGASPAASPIAAALAAEGLLAIAERLAAAAVGAVLVGGGGGGGGEQQQATAGASLLLATLIREFGTVVTTGPSPLPGTPFAALTSDGGMGGDAGPDGVAATSAGGGRLVHPSASFNLDSLVLACLSGPVAGPQSCAHADLLVSCLQASELPAAAWDAALITIAGESGDLSSALGEDEEDALELVVLLLERLVSGAAASSSLPSATAPAASSLASTSAARGALAGWQSAALDALALRIA